MVVLVVEGYQGAGGISHEQNVKNFIITDRHSLDIMGWVIMTEGLTLLRTVIYSAVL